MPEKLYGLAIIDPAVHDHGGGSPCFQRRISRRALFPWAAARSSGRGVSPVACDPAAGWWAVSKGWHWVYSFCHGGAHHFPVALVCGNNDTGPGWDSVGLDGLANIDVQALGSSAVWWQGGVFGQYATGAAPGPGHQLIEFGCLVQGKQWPYCRENCGFLFSIGPIQRPSCCRSGRPHPRAAAGQLHYQPEKHEVQTPQQCRRNRCSRANLRSGLPTINSATSRVTCKASSE